MHLLVFNLVVDYDDPVLAFSTDWINALARKVERLSVITMFRGVDNTAENVRVYSVGKEKRYSELKRGVVFYRLLARLLRTEKVDACFAHMMPLFAIMGGPILKLFGVPVVLWYAHGKLNWKVRVSEKVVDAIVTSSPEGCRLNSSKVKIIGQGIDTDKIAFQAFSGFGDTVRLLFVGRLAPVKGIHHLVDVMIHLQEHWPNRFSITIVGKALNESDEAYIAVLQQRVRACKLEKRVQFIGQIPIESIQEQYYVHDIMLNPSSTGSMDKTVLEAMAAGIFVITGNEAYDTTAYRQAGGFFASNEVVEICDCLLKILDMEEEVLITCAQRAREWVATRHSIHSMAEKVLLQLSASTKNSL